MSFKLSDGPSEEWEPLDWTTATKKEDAYESWEGCPVQTEDGAHFLGHGTASMIVIDDLDESNFNILHDMLLFIKCDSNSM